MKKYVDYDFAMSCLSVALATSGDKQSRQHIIYARKVFDMLPWEEAIPVSYIKKYMETSKDPAEIRNLLEAFEESTTE